MDKIIRPRLTCDSCKKRVAHDVERGDPTEYFNVSLRSSCCKTYHIMGAVCKRLVADGLPVRKAYIVERMYWEIHEPFESMTTTEKGFILSSIGIKTNYVDAFNGVPPKMTAKYARFLKHRKAMKGPWNLKLFKTSAYK